MSERLNRDIKQRLHTLDEGFSLDFKTPQAFRDRWREAPPELAPKGWRDHFRRIYACKTHNTYAMSTVTPREYHRDGRAFINSIIFKIFGDDYVEFSAAVNTGGERLQHFVDTYGFEDQCYNDARRVTWSGRLYEYEPIAYERNPRRFIMEPELFIHLKYGGDPRKMP